MSKKNPVVGSKARGRGADSHPRGDRSRAEQPAGKGGRGVSSGSIRHTGTVPALEFDFGGSWGPIRTISPVKVTLQSGDSFYLAPEHEESKKEGGKQ
jgi:hypothetical protein